ncbi:hypothetical protein SUDANB95_03153 [Actinosynnema sp. ALI-1.44]
MVVRAGAVQAGFGAISAGVPSWTPVRVSEVARVLEFAVGTGREAMVWRT